jgi:hypothetical protein
VRVQRQLDTLEVPLPLFVFVEELKNIYFDAPDGAIDMSVLAILLFVGTMAFSLVWRRTSAVMPSNTNKPMRHCSGGCLGRFAYNLSWPAPSFEVDQLLSVPAAADTIGSCADHDRGDGRSLRCRLDPRDLWYYARPVHRLHLQRLRYPWFAFVVFPARWCRSQVCLS